MINSRITVTKKLSVGVLQTSVFWGVLPPLIHLRSGRENLHPSMFGHILQIYSTLYTPVALMVVRCTNNRKVVGSMPANVVCITVDR